MAGSEVFSPPVGSFLGGLLGEGALAGENLVHTKPSE